MPANTANHIARHIVSRVIGAPFAGVEVWSSAGRSHGCVGPPACFSLLTLTFPLKSLRPPLVRDKRGVRAPPCSRAKSAFKPILSSPLGRHRVPIRLGLDVRGGI